MILTGKYRSTHRKPCPNSTLYITNPTGSPAALGLIPGIRGARTVTDIVVYGSVCLSDVCILLQSAQQR